jgi:hypothetical protein
VRESPKQRIRSFGRDVILASSEPMRRGEVVERGVVGEQRNALLVGGGAEKANDARRRDGVLISKRGA